MRDPVSAQSGSRSHRHVRPTTDASAAEGCQPSKGSEERDVGATNSWVGVPMTKIIIDLEQSLKKYPPIKAGTPEPYVTPK